VLSTGESRSLMGERARSVLGDYIQRSEKKGEIFVNVF